MSSSLDKLLEVGSNGSAVEVTRRREKHPPGFEPGVHVKHSGGSIVLKRDSDGPVDWTAVLRELVPESMNPDDYEIDGDTVEVRAWDGNVGMGEIKRFYYFKAKIRRKGDALGVDLDDIIAAAKAASVPSVKRRKSQDARTYFVQITDLQAGQADGDGLEGMVARALEIPKLVRADLDALEKSGRPASSIFVPITGDLVEGINGWYEMQQFSVSLDRRNQVKLVRRLLSEILMAIAGFGLPVHVAVVPGNHGENRHHGKAFTTLSDNDDVAILEQIAEAFQMAGSFKHVSFSFPQRDRLSLTVEVQGWIIGLTHGHLARSSGMPAGKILNWFKTMAGNRDPLGDSDVLFVGHYHHLICQQLIGDTLLVMGGALCDASSWFSQSSGLVSDPCIVKGTITKTAKIESLMPYFWDRTRVQTRTLED